MTERQHKSRRLSVVMTEREYRLLKDTASQNGETLSSFVRGRALPVGKFLLEQIYQGHSILIRKHHGEEPTEVLFPMISRPDIDKL